MTSTTDIKDNINPTHYRGFRNGTQVIAVTERLPFNTGNAFKYIARACRLEPDKNKGNILEDIKKSLWYVEREIARSGKISVEIDWKGEPEDIASGLTHEGAEIVLLLANYPTDTQKLNICKGKIEALLKLQHLRGE